MLMVAPGPGLSRLVYAQGPGSFISCSLPAFPSEDGENRPQASSCSAGSSWTVTSSRAARPHSLPCKLSEVPALPLGGPATSWVKGVTSRVKVYSRGAGFIPCRIVSCPPSWWLDAVLFVWWLSFRQNPEGLARKSLAVFMSGWGVPLN